MISIIMPFKNESAFLSQTIDSILEQSYENWELIAVDDHSSDVSFSIAKDYAIRDKRIFVLGNKGEGIINALQTGYEKARGSFITRMDADDLMLPYKLEQLRSVLLLSSNINSVAVGKVRYFKNDDSEIGNGFLTYEKWLNSIAEQGNSFNDIYKECPIPSPSWMMRKVTFEEIGAFNSEVYPEDYELAFRMYQYGLTPIATPDVVHLWRDYPSRTSRTHIHYRDNSFFELKVSQFISIDYTTNKELVLIGAGKKGKKIAKELIKHHVDFKWLSNNVNKVGHVIYGVKIECSDELLVENSQIIVAISSPEEQQQIKDNELKSNIYYYFC